MTEFLDGFTVMVLIVLTLAVAVLVAWAGVLALRRVVERVVMWIQVRRFASWRR